MSLALEVESGGLFGVQVTCSDKLQEERERLFTAVLDLESQQVVRARPTQINCGNRMPTRAVAWTNPRPAWRRPALRASVRIMFSEFRVARQISGPVERQFVIVLDAVFGCEAFQHAGVQDGFGLDLAESFGPLEAPPESAGLALVVLGTERVGIEFEISVVGPDAEAVHSLPIREVSGSANHPGERDIGQARLIFRIATAYVAVATREPDLLQPVWILVRSFRSLVVGPSPRHLAKSARFSSIDMAWRAYHTALFRCRS